MAKRKSTPAPTLAQLRRLAKRKVQNLRPRLVWRFSRYDIGNKHRALEIGGTLSDLKRALFAALSALPDPKTKKEKR